MRILYHLEGILFMVLYRMVRYRRKIVRINLERSFPSKDRSRILAVERKFYRYLSQLIIGSIKNLSISKSELLQRVVVKNPEVIDVFHEQGRSVLLVGSHFANWEYLITAQNLLFRHQAVGVGKPLSNGFWDKKLTQRRERFGLRVVHAKNLESKLQEWAEQKLAILILFDQSPPDSRRSYWHTFLGQPTAFFFGPEKIAVSKDLPIVQFKMKERKKGYYEVVLELVSANPRSLKYGTITEKLIADLEAQVLETPDQWLWSHNRWKREVPSDLTELRQKQRKEYNSWKSGLQ